MALSSMAEVLAALRAGKPVIVADDENRENEGDAILAAELAGPEWIAWMVHNTSGFLCAPMTTARAAALELPPMVVRNEDSLRTAYTVTVDASSGVTTGISAADRAVTLQALADPGSTPASFIRPGHVLPVVAVDGGVRQRPGHTEATVDLLKLAGLTPVGVIGEIVADDGSMARMPGLLALGEREGLPVTTIAALIEVLNERDAAAGAPDAAQQSDERHSVPTAAAQSAAADRGGFGTPQTLSAVDNAAADTAAAVDFDPARVRFEVETEVPTIHGTFRFRAYHDLITGSDHLAIIAGDPGHDGALVRVHSECLTGEAFGSLKCECGPQLDASLDLIAERGGAVIYLRGQEGRGIGLINKLRAYRLQEDGLDTYDANVALGFAVDSRDYGAAAAILHDLGVASVRLLTNNPDKVRQLEEHGIAVTVREPLLVGAGEANTSYLDAKRDRMGHFLPARAS